MAQNNLTRFTQFLFSGILLPRNALCFSGIKVSSVESNGDLAAGI